MKIEDCIFYQLNKAHQAAARFLSEKLAPCHVTAVQGVVLNFLFEEDDVTSKQLGLRTKLDSATLTGILDRLEAMELVERRRNPEDRRAISVCLTRKGKTLSGNVHETIQKANRELLTDFGAQEARALRTMLTHIHQDRTAR
jgi:DNA-binding MarR family transcriptional regulator